jgi:hypothetical protein
VARIPAAPILISIVLAIGACGILPRGSEVGSSVELEWQGTTVIATVSPWPLDNPVAFVCLRQPGDAFNSDHPVPPESAGCVPAGVAAAEDQLVAKFDRASLDPAKAAAFAARQQWFLAVAGSRGPLSVSTVLTVLNLPKAS